MTVCKRPGLYPRNEGAAGNINSTPRRDTDSLMVEPQGVFLAANGKPLAPCAKFFLHKGYGGGTGGRFLEKCHDMLNAMRLVAAAGQGATYDGIRYFGNRGAGNCGERRVFPRLLFLRLRLCNRYYLFLNRWEKGELKGFLLRRFRRRNGRFFTCRFLSFLIYL